MTTMRHTPRRGRPAHPRGVALIDVLIGGIMLGISLTVILSLTGRSLSMQTDGEKRLTAGWIADELLTMVLVEGPDNYPLRNDTSGRAEYPFEEYSFEVDIKNLGRGAPYRVSATVRWSDRPKDSITVESLIAVRLGEPEQPREPLETVDRDARYFPDEFDAPAAPAAPAP